MNEGVLLSTSSYPERRTTKLKQENARQSRVDINLRGKWIYSVGIQCVIKMFHNYFITNTAVHNRRVWRYSFDSRDQDYSLQFAPVRMVEHIQKLVVQWTIMAIATHQRTIFPKTGSSS